MPLLNEFDLGSYKSFFSKKEEKVDDENKTVFQKKKENKNKFNDLKEKHPFEFNIYNIFKKFGIEKDILKMFQPDNLKESIQLTYDEAELKKLFGNIISLQNKAKAENSALTQEIKFDKSFDEYFNRWAKEYNSAQTAPLRYRLQNEIFNIIKDRFGVNSKAGEYYAAHVQSFIKKMEKTNPTIKPKIKTSELKQNPVGRNLRK